MLADVEKAPGMKMLLLYLLAESGGIYEGVFRLLLVALFEDCN